MENIEDALKNYADQEEAKTGRLVVNPDLDDARATSHSSRSSAKNSLESQARKHIEELNNNPLSEAQAEVKSNIKQNMRDLGVGFVEVPVTSLPTQGIFYPEGTKFYIRAASGGEIRHWSMTDEDDFSAIDDALNYVLERCLKVKMPGMQADWKDCKEIDRFYLILSIRDFTFTKGNNELKVTVSEGKDVTVYKDNIDFIELDPKLMNHYSPEKRCFVFKTKSGGNVPAELNLYMPSVGVSNWLKGYIERKTRRQEGFDQDFASIAPMLIKDYRNLNDSTYEKFIASCMDYGVYEYSLIAKVKKLIQESISPKLKYEDEDGAEKTAPLNFRGGLKSLFLLDLDDVL